MKPIRNTAWVPCVLLALTGCIPEKRVVWSPDGKMAAVSTDRGLYFINGEGGVLPPRLAGSPTRCTWFKDGKRLVVAHVKKAGKWAEIAGLFDEATTKKIKEQAEKIRERILAYTGDWDKFKEDPDNVLSPGEEAATLLYIIDQRSQGVPEKLGKEWDKVKDTQVDVWIVQVFELAGDELKPGKILLQTMEEIHQAKVSPKGTAVAAVLADMHKESQAPTLHVMSTSGGPARTVASNVSFEYDWSPDGRSLAFVRATNLNEEKDSAVELGSLTTVDVADEKGELLPQWSKFEDCVGLLFSPLTGVKWLSDGRLMFASAEVTLPATRRDMPQRWSLFMFDPKMPAGVVRVLGRDFAEQLDASLPLFVVSPNERRVLLPGPGGRWTMYDIRQGEAKPLQTPDAADGKTSFLASWRNDDEICLPGPADVADKTAKTKEVLLWSNGKTRAISLTWPNEMKDGGWLQSGQSAPGTP